MTAIDLGLPKRGGTDGVPTTDEPQKAADYRSDQEVRWCPGCGDYVVLNAIRSFLPTLGIKRENVVFVSSDSHWLSVNNLTYQEVPFGPQIASSAIDITTMAVGTVPIAPLIPPFLVGFPPPLGLTAAQLAGYARLGTSKQL